MIYVNLFMTFTIDFDDAYQYSIAKYHELKVVTMDRDFERIKDVNILFL